MLLIALLSINGLLHYCSAQQSPFQLHVGNSDGGNINRLTLQCVDGRSTRSTDYTNIFFWINNTQRDLRDILGRDDSQTLRSSTWFTFVITQELEGFYFCGSDVNNTSEMIPLTGKYIVLQ